MNNKALQTVRRYKMLQQGNRIIAAVSGGADSMALLCFLLEIRTELSLSLSVCHVNHLLRGEEADRDEKFVRDFCALHTLPFYLLRCDVKALAQEKKLGFEECGRQVRYNFFDKTSQEIGGAKIATAHTLSDCAETLIFHLARGTSPAGLSSIAPVRNNIIRPLIECTREEIEAYLARISQPFMTDTTNFDTNYSRNFIRAQLIPALKKLNPAFEFAVQNLTELAREQAAFIEKQTDCFYKKAAKYGGIDRDKFLKADITLKRGIIAKLFTENNVMLTKKRCDEILSAAENGSFCISVCKDGFIICDDDNIIRFEKRQKKPKAHYQIPAACGEYLLPDGRILKLGEISQQEFIKIKKNSQKLLKNCLDYDIINNGFVFRPRKSGDFITLFPRNVTKTLKKLFNESKIPVEKRDIIPVLACSSHVFWVEGLGVDRSAAVSEQTQKILFIEIFEEHLRNTEKIQNEK